MQRLITTFLITLLIPFQITYAQWVKQTPGFAASVLVTDISVASPSSVWASSCYGYPFELKRDFARSNDGGATWTNGTITNDASLYISGIYGFDQQEAWACLAYPADSGGFLYHTSDGGLNWSRQDSAVFDNCPVLVHFWTKDTGLCIGNPHNSYFQIYTTVDGGNDWQAVDEINMPGALDNHFIVPSSFFVKGDTVYFSGFTQGRIYVSYNRGKDWGIITFPESTASYIAFRDSIGFGAYLDINNNNYTLYKSLDYGQTWSKLNVNCLVDCFNISYIPGTPGTLICTALGNFLISDDWGENWRILEGPASTSPYYCDIEFIDNVHGWVAGWVYENATGGVYKYNGPALEINNINKISDQFSIYPNPVTDILTIELNTERSMPVKAELMDVSGKIANQWDFTSTSGQVQHTVNLKGIQSGMYILRLTTGEAVSFNKLIVK